MIKIKCEQGSELWFTARCGRVTGTRFKSLVAKESTQTYKDLLADIVCEIITGRKEESYSNAIMEHGVETEPIARTEYERLFETEVEQVGFVIPDEDNKYHEWIGISPDGMTDGLLEIKCPLMKTHLKYISKGIFPSDYRYQVQGQLFVTGLPYCDFMSYVEGMKPFIVRVYPEPELFKLFEERLDTLIELIKLELETYEKYNYHGEQAYIGG